MSRFVNAAMLGLVAFVLIAAILLYSPPEGEADTPTRTQTTEGFSTSVASLAWGLVDAETSELKADVVVANLDEAPANITRIDHEVFLGDLRVAHGSRELDPSIGVASQNVTIEITTPMRTQEVLDWLLSQGAADEATTLQLRGTLFIDAASSVEADFEASTPWEFSFDEGLAAGVGNCPSGSEDLCLERVEVSSGSAGGVLARTLTLTLHNTGDEEARIEAPIVRFALAGTTVASGEADETLELEPDETGDLQIQLSFAQEGLATWWAQHAPACESSPLQFRIEMTVTRPGGDDGSPLPTNNSSVPLQPEQTSSVQWTIPGDTLRTRLLCDES